MQAWLPGIKSLLARGISPPLVALALGYYEAPLTSGESLIQNRFSKVLQCVAETAGTSVTELGKRIVALVARDAKQDTFDKLKGMRDLVAGLPNVREAGLFFAQDADHLEQGIRQVAAMTGWPIPRLEGPSSEWCEILGYLIAKVVMAPATLWFIVRHNRLELKDGRRCEPLSFEAAVSTVATATGISDVEMRQIVLGSPRNFGDGSQVERNVAQALAVASLLMELPPVVRAEKAEPPLLTPRSRRLQPGEAAPKPPWEAFPEPPTSMRWRMGPGEDYMDKWHTFWRGLTASEKREYLANHVPPAAWAEWATRALQES
ncbi:MAG: hypothetical protein ACKVPX_17550 [Myxococcaceae bacterium]